jgi:hypothetical protein
VCRVEQWSLLELANSALALVGTQDPGSELRLMNPLADDALGVPPLVLGEMRRVGEEPEALVEG